MGYRSVRERSFVGFHAPNPICFQFYNSIFQAEVPTAAYQKAGCTVAEGFMAYGSRIHLESLCKGSGNIWGLVFAMFRANSNTVDYKPEYPEAT